nr:reverse transcriptase domain-containing protein [Tanacetum cinerariifolium]
MDDEPMWATDRVVAPTPGSTIIIPEAANEFAINEEDFDALLDEGSEILHSIEGTILEEKLFAEFDEFMAMTADENSESDSDTEEPPFKKTPLTPIIRSRCLLKNLLRILNSNLFLIT